jgi:hypothetical protein
MTKKEISGGVVHELPEDLQKEGEKAPALMAGLQRPLPIDKHLF